MSAPRNPVGWFEIYVQDMDRARAFYEQTFELSLQRLDMPEVEIWTFPMHDDAPGCPGALVRMAGKDSGAGGTILYFSTVDCAVVAGCAAEHGGQVIKDKFPIGEYGFIAFVQDTEGNVIGLHSLR